MKNQISHTFTRLFFSTLALVAAASWIVWQWMPIIQGVPETKPLAVWP